MRERFDKLLAAAGLTEEEAIDSACMTWVCQQELHEARKPRVWTRDDLPALVNLVTLGEITFGGLNDGSGDLLITDHKHPFYGLIVVRPAELINEAWSEAWK